MNLPIDREALGEAVAWAMQAIGARPTTPTLASVRLSWDGAGTLAVSGFDFDTYAAATIPATGDKTPGDMLVSGGMLAQICKLLPREAVTLGVAGGFAEIRCGSATWRIRAALTDDYPAAPPIPEAAGVIPGGDLAALIGGVLHAAGRDDELPVLLGVRIEADGKEIRAAATDRYRLHITTAAWQPEADLRGAVALIPARALPGVARAAAAAGPAPVTVHLGDDEKHGTLAGFSFTGRSLVTRQLAGEFPSYQSILAGRGAPQLTVNMTVGPLVEAVKRVGLVGENHEAVVLAFRDGELEVTCGDDHAATAREAIAADLDWAAPDHPEEVRVRFNPAYLIDALTGAGQETMRFLYHQDGKPATITDCKDQPAYSCLLMPVRVEGK